MTKGEFEQLLDEQYALMLEELKREQKRIGPTALELAFQRAKEKKNETVPIQKR